VRAVVHALHESRLGDTILVQDLSLLALIEMLIEEDRTCPADAALLACLRIDGSSLSAQDLIGQLL